MTESDGISLPLSRIVKSLLEGFKPLLIVDFIEWNTTAGEQLLNLHHQIMAWIAEV